MNTFGKSGSHVLTICPIDFPKYVKETIACLVKKIFKNTWNWSGSHAYFSFTMLLGTSKLLTLTLTSSVVVIYFGFQKFPFKYIHRFGARFPCYVYLYEKKGTLHWKWYVILVVNQARFEIVWASRNSAMIHYLRWQVLIRFFFERQVNGSSSKR